MTNPFRAHLRASIAALIFVFVMLTALPACADIVLKTPADLLALASRDFSQISSETIVLANDIDMTGQPALKTLGQGKPFTGTFDGQGHVIRNLTIKGTKADMCSGLLGYVAKPGSVKKLGLENVTVTGDYNTGAIAGVLTGSVSECYVTGSVKGTRYTGGIAGMLYAGSIENCLVKADIDATRCVGGLFGGTRFNTQNYNTPLTQTGVILPEGSMVIRNNITLGSVIANRYAAGIVGEMKTADSSALAAFEGNVAWVDSVSVRNENYYGHVYADWAKAKTISADSKSNLYWDGMVLTGIGNTGSNTNFTRYTDLKITATSKADLGKQITYENLGWDFDSVWTWDQDLGHPVLKSVKQPFVNKVRSLYIGTAEELLALCTPDQYEDLSNDNIYLTADIDMDGYSITPLCAAYPFNGLFDGQDHILKNLTIKGVDNLKCTGLFGYVGEDGRIRNLGLEKVDVVAGSNPGTNTGAIAGVLSGGVSECFVTGKVSGMRYSGGIAGLLNGGSIENCWTDIVFAGSRYCGGLFGGTTYNTRSSGSPLSESSTKSMTVRNNLTLGAVAANRYPAGIAGEVASASSSPLAAFEGNVSWINSIRAKATDTVDSKGNPTNKKDYYGPVFADWTAAIPAVSKDNLYFDKMKLDGLAASSTQTDLYDDLRIKTATAEALGVQKTYEDLGWDFEKTWVWSEKLGHPVLWGFAELDVPGEQKTPASLVTTFAGDAKTTRAFTWYTDSSVTGTIVQAVPSASYQDETSFSSGSAITKTGTSYALETAADGTSRNIHQVNLTGLTAGTAYSYRAGDGTNWSKVYTFTTEPEDADSFTFLSMTDTQNQYVRYLDALRQSTAAYPDSAFILHSGDVIQNNITGDYDELFDITQRFAATLPTMVSPGNHELAKDDKTNDGEAVNYVKGLANFKSHYLYPSNGPAGGDQVIYSFDYGNAHFICLNSNTSGYPSYEEQIAWMEKDLASTDKAWRIVSIHHGPYNSGGKGKNIMISAMQDLDIDLVLFGHNHIFLRSNPITDGVQETIAPIDGVYYAEAGSPSYYSSGCAGGNAGSISSSPYFVIHKNPTGGSVYGAITVTEDTLTVRSHGVSAASRASSQPFDTYVIRKPKATGSVVGAALTYNGKPQKLIDSAAAEGGEMLYSLDGVNFSASIPTAVDAGSYTVYCKVQGGSQNSDSDVQTLDVTIAPLDISTAASSVTLGEPPVHTGKEVTQTVESVTANGLPVTYKVEGNTGKDVGEYSLTITGTGNFTGSVTVAWRIVPAPVLPQTGDRSALLLWCTLAGMALLGMLGLRKPQRQH